MRISSLYIQEQQFLLELVLFCIMTFALRHILSGEALLDMLTLICAHCISPNLCMKSLFELKKHFHSTCGFSLILFHLFSTHQQERWHVPKFILCPRLNMFWKHIVLHKNSNCIEDWRILCQAWILWASKEMTYSAEEMWTQHWRHLGWKTVHLTYRQ